MSNEKTTNVAVVSGSADPKPAVKDASAESKIDFKVKKVRIERLDVKGTLSYRGFTKISGKVVSVKVARGWETFSPNCEVPVSEIIELREATPAQLKRYNKDQKKVKIDFEL
jgi:hypothetical protein